LAQAVLAEAIVAGRSCHREPVQIAMGCQASKQAPTVPGPSPVESIELPGEAAATPAGPTGTLLQGPLAALKGQRRVVVDAPEHAAEAGQADARFSRCSKRKATPFTGKGGAAALVHVSDDEDDNSSAGVAEPTVVPKVTIVAPPEEPRATNAEFSRTSKRKATPFAGKGSAAMALPSSDEEDSEEEVEEANVPRVTIVAPPGAGEGTEGAFSRTTKRKATPFLKAPVVVDSEEDEDDEPEMRVVPSTAAVKRDEAAEMGAVPSTAAVRTVTEKAERRVVVHVEDEEADSDMQRSGTFQRSTKRKATPWTSAKDAPSSRSEVTICDPEPEEDNDEQSCSEEDEGLQRTGTFQRTSKRKATPWHVAQVVSASSVVVILEPGTGPEEEDADDAADAASEEDDKMRGTGTFQRTSKRKATPWHDARSSTATTVLVVSDASDDEDEVEEEEEDPSQTRFERSSKRKATPWIHKPAAAEEGEEEQESAEEEEEDRVEEVQPVVPAAAACGLWPWTSCCVQAHPRDGELLLAAESGLNLKHER